MPEVIINRFDGQISEDKRVKDPTKFSVTKHFDTFTYPHKLVPYNKFAAFAGENKTLDIVRFVYAPRSASTYKLFGFGVASGTLTQAGVYMTDPGNDLVWETPSNNESSLINRAENVFFEYKGYIYMFANGTKLIRFDTDSGTAFDDAYQPVPASGSYSTLAEPVHHPSDDCAYFFADNVVYRLNNATWNGAVLTLPTNMKITAGCAYGNYLAVACVTKGTFAVRSTVFLWDRDSSIGLVSESIDFGEGSIRHLATLDGVIIAVMDYYSDNSFANNKGKIYIKRANGNTALILNTLTMDTESGTSTNPALPDTRVVRDNKLYFPASVQLNGDTRLGIWVTDSRGRCTISQVVPDATRYEAIYAIANMWWVAHSNDGSTERTVEDTGGGTGYDTSNAAIYESLIQDNGDPSRKKKLMGVTVFSEPLPTAGQVVLKYRKDGDTSWTTIFTEATDSSISHSAINIESSGTELPEYKELEFRIESTGGAVITGLKYKYEIIDRDIY